MIVLGIDPGVNGGLAWVGPEQPIAVLKMAETRAELINVLRAMPADLVVIERQEPRPTYWKDTEQKRCPRCTAVLEEDERKRSILKSTVVLFGGYCATLGILETLGRRIEDVRPQRWQTALGIPKKAGKPGLKTRAQQIFPEVKVTNWNADALLLAEFGRRLVGRSAG